MKQKASLFLLFAAFLLCAGCAYFEIRGHAMALAACGALSGLLFALAAKPPPSETTESPVIGVTFRGLCLGAALIAVGAALYYFYRGEAFNVTAWRLYAVGLVALVASGYERGGRIPRGELVCLLAVLAVAAALRFYHLGTLPYGVWFDEAQNTLVSKEILSKPGYRPVFIAGFSQMPAMPFYYYAPFIKVFGDGVFSIRLAVTMLGLGSIVTTWLLTREMFGPRTALLAAGFLAVSRWHLTFSRFGMANMFVVFFAPLVLYYFLRSQRRGSKGDALMSGISLGLGLQTYYSFLAFPLLLFIVGAHRLVLRQKTSLLAFITTLLSAALVYAPVALFAYNNWAVFTQRLSTVATLTPTQALKLAFDSSPEAKAKLAPIEEAALKHARMFHFEGDHNGRHNIPNEPMLDLVSGALVVAGLFFTLFRIFDWRSTLLVACSGLFLSAGIFSLTFEAPQGARTLGLTPLIAILCALPLALAAEKSRGTRAAAFVHLLVVGVLLASGALSFSTFDRQLVHHLVWKEFSAAQTRIAEITREVPRGTEVVGPDTLADGPVLTLLKSPTTPLSLLHPAAHIPLPCTSDRFVFTFGPEQTAWHSLVRALYPNAQARTFTAPDSPDPLLYEVYVTANDVRRLCLNRDQLGGLDHVWARVASPGMPEAGQAETPRGVRAMTPAEILSMPDGAVTDIYRPDIPLGGLTGKMSSLKPGRTIPDRAEVYPVFDLYFHIVPVSEIPYRITWTGTLTVETEGSYEMQIAARDGYTLSIDGNTIVSSPDAGNSVTPVHLSPGEHPVVLTLNFETGYFSLKWSWRNVSTGSPFEVIPTRLLKPSVN